MSNLPKAVSKGKRPLRWDIVTFMGWLSIKVAKVSLVVFAATVLTFGLTKLLKVTDDLRPDLVKKQTSFDYMLTYERERREYMQECQVWSVDVKLDNSGCVSASKEVVIKKQCEMTWLDPI